VRGNLYIPYTLYLVLYVIIGFSLCYRFYPKSTTPKEKTQTKLLIAAISVPLVGGISTQIIPVILGIKMIPMTSILTTITAIIIAYAIVKHKLMVTGSFSIYRKLVVSFFIVIVLVLNVGFFSVTNSRELLEKSVGEGSLFLVSEIMNEVDITVYNRVEEFQLQVDSQNYGFQELVKKSNQEFSILGSEQNIYDYINEMDMKWIYTLGNETNPFMENLLNSNMSRILNDKIEFYEKAYNYSVFGEIFVTNEYGANVGQTGITSDYYQADEEWWQNGREDGLYLGEVGYDKSADIYSIDIIVRIDDENGNFIGILKAVWNIEEIINVLEKSRLSEKNNQYESMRCLLLDSSGRLIYSTKEFVFLENKSDVLPILIGHHGEEDSFFISSDSSYDEKEKLIVHSHSKKIMNFEGLDWTLIVEYDTEDIFASANNLWNTIIIASFIITMTSLLFVYIISRSISKPIIKLRDISKEIGTGNLDVKVDVYSKDEVGELATTFKTMAYDLKKSRNELNDYSQNLERKVIERTRELEKSRDILKNNIEKLEKHKLAMSHITRDLNEKNKELQDTYKKLEMFNEELERKVDVRTAEIKRLLKQKDEFIGQLGHDLKNPLGPLINLIPLLEKKETDPESKKILEILNRNTDHMKNLVVNTVALGRLNSQNVKFKIEDTNLLDEINNVIDRNSLLLKENNIEIENKAEKNIILKADKLRLTELFDNIIGNSVKYSPDGGTITIDVKQDRDFVTVSIKDIGMGMTEEQLTHIFDEFYKADESRHDFDSSGLGLPICKRIVERHGGKIWAESLGEGKGTTMFFTLPVSSKKADEGKTD
jgi:signal transduction histidine kinase